MSNWGVIILSLSFSAFFSGMEIAFVTANKLKIELDKQSTSLNSKLLNYVLATPSKYIATMLVGNNISLVIFGVVMAKVLEPFIVSITNSTLLILILQTIASTLVVLVVAEFLPKVVFRLNPNRWLNFFAFPLFVFSIFLSPLVKLILVLSNLILKWTRFKLIEDNQEFLKVDLAEYLDSSSERNKEHNDMEVQIFQNALDFGNVKLRECMVPRTEIISIEINQSINDLLKLFIKTNLSKIIVFEENIDKIIGYVHSSEMYKSPDSIKSILRPVPFVPESMHANELLEVFSKQRKGIATIVDEFGGTSGIVTVEDVVEEIFGEIEDEHDAETLLEKQVNDSTFLFSARLEVDYVNDKYHLELPLSNEYETLSGLLISFLENIPKKEEKLNIDGYEIIVKKVSDTKIEQVCVIKA